MKTLETHHNLTLSQLAHFVDNMPDELLVIDKDLRIVYVNNACKRHYGRTQKELIGTTIWYGCEGASYDLTKTLVPSVFRFKRPMEHAQRTYTGASVYTTAVPLFDDLDKEVEYVVMNVRDERQKTGTAPIITPSPILTPAVEGSLVYRSKAMHNVVQLAHQVSAIDSPCLISGDTGTGKSLLAKYIHNNSPRAAKNFVSINCASIPHGLFESELFGHKKGAFTHAICNKKGLLAEAEGGTIFLDEISELPLEMQAKLLNTLQEREYRPVGDTRSYPFDVKILAATNRNIDHMIKNKVFRADLYYRINVFEITIPPLRERIEDIIPLCMHFKDKFEAQYGHIKTITAEALSIICQYEWPGNIREVSHLMERLAVTNVNNEIRPVDLPAFLYKRKQNEKVPPETEAGLDASLLALEKEIVNRAYKTHQTVRSVAKHLGVSTTRAFRLLKKHTSQAH
ncbi:MAG: sigma 54-interacting transcriptional regulator [Desulfobacterales bacterium]|nr:sigma 54-interacting transcriptional regulator [Desulfobacterales bacterium]